MGNTVRSEQFKLKLLPSNHFQTVQSIINLSYACLLATIKTEILDRVSNLEEATVTFERQFHLAQLEGYAADTECHLNTFAVAELPKNSHWQSSLRNVALSHISHCYA